MLGALGKPGGPEWKREKETEREVALMILETLGYQCLVQIPYPTCFKRQLFCTGSLVREELP